MRIGIITFHFVLNQGAVLQCLAMQKYLEKQGHEVKIIDYRPKYLTVRSAALKNPFYYAKWYTGGTKKATLCKKIYIAGRSFARCIVWNIKGRDRIKSKLFSEFVKKHIRCTEKYVTLKSLQTNPPKMDAYISGSDQLWNPDLLDHKFDPAYFLDFGKSDCMRISYAVSMGKEFSEEECQQLAELCVGIDAISLRENTPVAMDAINRDVHICVDPTLLLNAEDYACIESDTEETEPYIFVYGLETSEAIMEAVERAKKLYACKVINGSPEKVRLKSETVVNICNYTPDRFLTFIKNAKCVVTNSFHGTVFSIIYRKQFVTVPHTTRGRRMIELLHKLGLSHVLWEASCFSMEKEIDYVSVYEKLEELRKDSKNYLEKALEGYRGEDIPHLICDNEDKLECSSKKYEGIQAKYGYYKDDELVKQSASGGASSVLAETILLQNGEHSEVIIYGVTYSDDFKSARFRRASTLSELEAFKGSKYIKADMKMANGEYVFSCVEKDLREGKIVLFTGLGCEVGALKKYLETHSVDDSNLYTVDLICHGPTLATVQEDYITTLEKKFRSKVISFSARYKKKGWKPPYVHAVFLNGKVYDKPLYETEFGYAFKTYLRESCYSCKFKGVNHLADLTIGDYWGVVPGMQSYNKNGVSIIFARTEKGNELLQRVDSSIFIIGDADFDLALRNNRMFETSYRKPVYRDMFMKDFNEKGLHYACVHSPGYKQYKKAAIKKMIKRGLNL